MEHRDSNTRWEGRTAASTPLSEGVSDEACPTRANHRRRTPHDHASASDTRRPRGAGIAEVHALYDRIFRPDLTVAGLARSPSAMGVVLAPTGSGERTWSRPGAAGCSSGARARPPGWELQTAAGAAGRHPQTGRTATRNRSRRLHFFPSVLLAHLLLRDSECADHWVHGKSE